MPPFSSFAANECIGHAGVADRPTGQGELFAEYCLGAAHLSRILPLWDLLPLFLFSRRNELPSDTRIGDINPRKHEFSHRLERIAVIVRPGLIDGRGNVASRLFFPGEREQLITAAIRALAVRRVARMGTKAGEDGRHLVTVAFTIRQVRAELEATKHTFSHTEIIEALEILKTTSVTVSRTLQDEDPIDMTFLYYHDFMSQGDKRLVVLNALESQQILAGTYRAVHYSRIMGFSDPLARWLYLYIHAEHRGARKPQFGIEPPPFTITLTQLFARGLLQPTKELRKSILRVRNAFEVLAEAGVLHRTDECPGYELELTKEATRGRSRITDAAWRLFLSEREVDRVIDENAEAKYRSEGYEHLQIGKRLELAAPARQRLAKQ